jgi:hypothetical protein
MIVAPEDEIRFTPDIFGGPPHSEYLRGLWRRSRDRARKDKIEFTINVDDVERMCHEQQRRCEVTGLPFSRKCDPAAFVKYPFAPSIDRRDSSRGYTSDNIRLVCTAVNFGLGQWGDELYLTLARAAVANEARRRAVVP